MFISMGFRDMTFNSDCMYCMIFTVTSNLMFDKYNELNSKK